MFYHRRPYYALTAVLVLILGVALFQASRPHTTPRGIAVSEDGARWEQQQLRLHQARYIAGHAASHAVKTPSRHVSHRPRHHSHSKTGTAWSAAHLSGAFAALRQCEAGGDYTLVDTPYYGAYQFDRETWASTLEHMGVHFDGLPSSAPPGLQDAAAKDLQHERGWAPWPACSRKLGLR